MKIYPCLSYRREINETNVNYTCNWQKVWDSSDSLNGYLIYNSSDQRKFFNTMECDHREKSEKGEGKRTICKFYSRTEIQFSRFFFVLLCVQNLCCNDSKYHSLKLKGHFSHECWRLWERAVQFLVFLGIWHLQTADHRLQIVENLPNKGDVIKNITLCKSEKVAWEQVWYFCAKLHWPHSQNTVGYSSPTLYQLTRHITNCVDSLFFFDYRDNDM